MKHKNAKPVASKRPNDSAPPLVTCPTCGFRTSRYGMKKHKEAHYSLAKRETLL